MMAMAHSISEGKKKSLKRHLLVVFGHGFWSNVTAKGTPIRTIKVAHQRDEHEKRLGRKNDMKRQMRHETAACNTTAEDSVYGDVANGCPPATDPALCVTGGNGVRGHALAQPGASTC